MNINEPILDLQRLICKVEPRLSHDFLRREARHCIASEHVICNAEAC